MEDETLPPADATNSIHLEQSEVLEAVVLLASRVKAVEGLDIVSFVKNLSHQKQGLELAKACYIQLLKAVTMADGALNSEAEATLDKQLQSITLEELKAKVAILKMAKQEQSVKVSTEGDENPLVNVLQDKQYKANLV